MAINSIENNLLITNPNLAKEWHPTKNGKLRPVDVTSGSDKKVWWLLPYDDPKTGKHFDFEWEARVKHRANGSGCPIIAGKVLWPGFNDLATRRPDLVEEWDYSKNGSISPSQVAYGSDLRVWWKKKYEDPKSGNSFVFEWEATVGSRVRGSGCPYISGNKAWPGFNDLKTIHPDIASEWHPTRNGTLKPSEVTPGSNQKVWWLLPYDDPKTGKHFDFEWETTVQHRVNGRCPFLSGRAVWSGFNDLRTINPKLAMEWHPTKNGKLTPDDIAVWSSQKVWWLLPYDDPKTGKHFEFEWKADIASRMAGNECPYISNKAVWVGYNDLMTVNPELASEWHPTKNGDLKPSDVTINSGKRVWWLYSYDDLKTGKHFDFEWEATVTTRSYGHGCPYLSSQAVWPGYNDLETNAPELVKEWHPTKNGKLKPYDVAIWSSKVVWWLLPYDDPKTGKHFDFEWKSSISNRMSGNGCPYIAGKAVWPGYNDIETVNPKLAGEWHPIKNGNLRPKMFSYGSSKKVWWICKKDHEWKSSISSRNKGNGCPKCFSELTTSFPEYVILYYVKQLERSVIHSYKELGFELDVYIPSKKIAFEYDGAFWHKNKRAMDIEKNKKCVDNGITLYRFRENELETLDDSSIDYNVTAKTFMHVLGSVLFEIYGRTVDIDLDRDLGNINELRDFSEKEKSLSVMNPELAKEWHPTKNGNLTPESVSVKSSKRVWWLLPYDDPETGKHFDFEWVATVGDRVSGNGCPYLSNRMVYAGYNDLETTNPDVSNLWNSNRNGDLKPCEVTRFSTRKVWWYLKYEDSNTGKKFDFEWKKSIYEQVKSGKCPYLTGHSVWPEYNDLETMNPKLASEWHPTKNDLLTPRDVTSSSGKKVWWLLPYDDPNTGKHFDFEWEATIASRNDGAECPYLCNQKIWIGFNDLKTVCPSLAGQWDYEKNDVLPTQVTSGSSKNVWWKCDKCGYSWKASINNRFKGSGCPKCAKARSRISTQE